MTCPACGADDTTAFYARSGVPVHSCLLLESQDEARAFPKGDLTLEFCNACAFIFNSAYDPALSRYSPDYEETQGFSAHFQEFLTELAARWVERHSLQGRRVVEIGSGKGEFLVELVRHGVADAVGVDPGGHPDRIPRDVRDKVSLVRGFFPGDMPEIEADAVICRHTLEHIGPVAEFMRQVREAIGDRTETVVLFELPDVLRVLREAAFWDVYYEHCSYFTLGSLARLFRRTGFDILDLSMAYDDQYLLIEARPSSSDPEGEQTAHAAEEDLATVAEAVSSFQKEERSLVQMWSDELRTVTNRGGRTAIWGSGSKGVAFLAALGTNSDAVQCAVDINPYKHGKFMAGTGHRIVPPSELPSYRPDLVVAMNPVYVNEIQRDLDALELPVTLKAL